MTFNFLFWLAILMAFLAGWKDSTAGVCFCFMTAVFSLYAERYFRLRELESDDDPEIERHV